MPSKQATFNRVVKHLRAQNAKALGDDESCQYLAPDGKRCAAGCLIPFKEYNPSFEGQSVCFASPTELTMAGKFIKKKGHDIRLVRDLQNIHDNYEPKQWNRKFKETAKEFNLEYTKP